MQIYCKSMDKQNKTLSFLFLYAVNRCSADILQMLYA